MNGSPPARVLVLEDDPLFRASLVEAIEATADLQIAGVAGSIAEARRLLSTARSRVGVFDLCLPDGSSLDLVGAATAMGMVVLVVSVLEDEETVYRAIAAGAAGYLLKPASRADLQRAIGDVLRGGSPISPRIARWLLEDFRRRAPPATPSGPALTTRESQVVELFAKGATYSDVANELGISVNTVREYVRALYEKLQVSSKTEAVMKLMPHVARS